MTPSHFKSIRKKTLRLSRLHLARALGYDGTRNTVRAQISKFENGSREVSPWIARLMLMFELYGVPLDFKDHPDFRLPNSGLQ